MVKIRINESESIEFVIPDELDLDDAIIFRNKLDKLVTMATTLNQLGNSRLLSGAVVEAPKESLEASVEEIVQEPIKRNVGRPKGSKTKNRKKAEKSNDEKSDNNGYSREAVQSILSAHYNRDFEKRDNLLALHGMSKATMYVMKNRWIKKFGFTKNDFEA